MAQYQGKNLEKDFELFLVGNKLWKPYHENEYSWIDRLGNLMDVAAKRTAEENKHLKDDDIKWWLDLCILQGVYGKEVDIFGSYLEARSMTNFRNGQFFTPMNICDLMAELVLHDGEGAQKDEPITVSDCASGTGRMMIAHANMAAGKAGYSPIKFKYYNQDIDYKSFVFSTLNAVLRNLYSVNVWGDSLAVTERKVYFTIPTMFGYSTWHDRDHELSRLNESECIEIDIRKAV